jgi:hypothetical protein
MTGYFENNCGEFAVLFLLTDGILTNLTIICNAMGL